MPIYPYRCKSCRDEFDIKQSMLESALTVCQHCGGELQRLISKNVGIAFKGQGFYINDSVKTAKETTKSTDAISSEDKKKGSDVSKKGNDTAATQNLTDKPSNNASNNASPKAD